MAKETAKIEVSIVAERAENGAPVTISVNGCELPGRMELWVPSMAECSPAARLLAAAIDEELLRLLKELHA